MLPQAASTDAVRRSPVRLLVLGLALSMLTVGAFGIYTRGEIRRLGDELTAISERNRKDSLQLLRIQNDLAWLAFLMRDMADRVEPYPMWEWRPAFDRLRRAPPRGLLDLAPAYTTILLTFDLRVLDPGDAATEVLEVLSDPASEAPYVADGGAREVEVPVCYEGDCAPDLGDGCRIPYPSVTRPTDASKKGRFSG